MRRISLCSFAAAAALVLGSPVTARQQPARPPVDSTCDQASINAQSYELTTTAQARNALRPREPWWEPYGIWNTPAEIGDVNDASTRLAERARELDERNLLAHGYLARQYVVLAIDATKAEQEWRRVIDNGGAIVWTGSLYELDPRSFFILGFDARGIRVFRFASIAGELRTHFGVPDFPGPDRVEFWRALGGCIPATVAPETEIPWSAVRELRVTPWTLRFDLKEKVTIGSDRGRHRTDDTLEVNLHPHTGDIDFRFGMTPFGRPPVNADPAAYHQRVKQMIDTFFM